MNKISDLINTLQAIKNSEGDLPIQFRCVQNGLRYNFNHVWYEDNETEAEYPIEGYIGDILIIDVK